MSMDAVKARAEAAEKRTADVILAEIVTKLATIDGIAVADAFALGGLVREYGERRAGEASGNILFPLLDSMLSRKPGDSPTSDSKPPWL